MLPPRRHLLNVTPVLTYAQPQYSLHQSAAQACSLLSTIISVQPCTYLAFAGLIVTLCIQICLVCLSNLPFQSAFPVCLSSLPFQAAFPVAFPVCLSSLPLQSICLSSLAFQSAPWLPSHITPHADTFCNYFQLLSSSVCCDCYVMLQDLDSPRI